VGIVNEDLEVRDTGLFQVTILVFTCRN